MAPWVDGVPVHQGTPTELATAFPCAAQVAVGAYGIDDAATDELDVALTLLPALCVAAVGGAPTRC